MPSHTLVTIWAHPRSRGENLIRRRWRRCMVGSSPLTRGKRRMTTMSAGPTRLIPAHAGKTNREPPTTCGPWAHPRSRGENRVIKPGGYLLAGSSPLTRGKLSDKLREQVRQRLIPAHAGKTGRPVGLRARLRAHPRSRGENSCGQRIGHSGLGSSPLTRGKRPSTRPGRSTPRLIPAHAGKTVATWARWAFCRAHPRSRGENPERCGLPGYEHGSSPLTRGKLQVASSVLIDVGLIPAHAGKTSNSTT